jgi:ribosomal protein S21
MKVSLDEVDGNVEKMIKRFLKKTKKMRIVEDCYDRRYYTKPSQAAHTKRRQKARALEKEKAATPKED